MGLKSEKTNWIFLLTSQDEPELRHVDDVGFGIDSLIRSGIAIEDITIIIDSSKQTTLQVIREKEGFNSKTIYKSSELKELFKKNNYDNIVLFVNGHGNYNLIDAYKYVSYCVIEFCHYQKITNLLIRKAYENIIYKGMQTLKDKTISDTKKKFINSQITSLKRKLLPYDHPQEPWILNAIEAMNIYL